MDSILEGKESPASSHMPYSLPSCIGLCIWLFFCILCSIFYNKWESIKVSLNYMSCSGKLTESKKGVMGTTIYSLISLKFQRTRLATSNWPKDRYCQNWVKLENTQVSFTILYAFPGIFHNKRFKKKERKKKTQNRDKSM